jgi:AraC family transcriptional regulator, transcriptional activator of pobA
MNDILTIANITLAQQHQLMSVAKPKHPMFSIIRFEDLPKIKNDQRVKLISDFYQITLKNDCPCKFKYGQTQYDFDEGIMAFFSPKQVNIVEPGAWIPTSGWLLLIHPDFLRGFALSAKIKSYGFFDYSLNEALILSEEEDQSIQTIFAQIEKEYLLPIDSFSQEVVISNLDLLLTYCNRYYNRQFIVRKTPHNDLLTKFEGLLNEYFNSEKSSNLVFPTVTYFAEKLNLSSKYLSELLHSLTGKSTQVHIHEKLIEKAKEKLSTTNLTVSEIAYELGFEHSQSFSKLFKNKVGQSPVEFRVGFN